MSSQLRRQSCLPESQGRNKKMDKSTTSAVKFSGTSRVHIGLAVSDLNQSKHFYQTLLGQPPTKERLGYVKFETADPSVNLSLNQSSGTLSRGLPTTAFRSSLLTQWPKPSIGSSGRDWTLEWRRKPLVATLCRNRSGSTIPTGTSGKCSSSSMMTPNRGSKPTPTVARRGTGSPVRVAPLSKVAVRNCEI